MWLHAARTAFNAESRFVLALSSASAICEVVIASCKRLSSTICFHAIDLRMTSRAVPRFASSAAIKITALRKRRWEARHRINASLEAYVGADFLAPFPAWRLAGLTT